MTPHGSGPVLALGTMVLAIAAAVWAGRTDAAPRPHGDDTAWLQDIETGDDHIAPAELARLLLTGDPGLRIVDVRPADEFAAWHLPGAVHRTVPELCTAESAPLFDARLVVLCSHGPAHPGQAWVALRAAGRTNVRVLDGGLAAFQELLTPPSLRVATDAATAQQPGTRHEYALLRAFCTGPSPRGTSGFATDPSQLERPTAVSSAWLAARAGTVAVVAVRNGNDGSPWQVPGARRLDLASLRVRSGDRDHRLVDDAALARAFGALGLTAETPVVLYADDAVQDATMAALALLRLGHRALAVLDGGLLRWAAERRPLAAPAAPPAPTVYVPRAGADDFTITTDALATAVAAGTVQVLDVRPVDFFTGARSTEARPGHVPGARNRPFARDLVAGRDGTTWRPAETLRADYAAIGVPGERPIVVSCRTGHTASHTFFVLRHLLGQPNVRWYEGSWTEWAARADLPAATGER